ncbi:MAG TPA: molecular chaperone DnaJ [Desulfurivibrio alkaliphilus]|uniref:Molecular chaperone DnaJ n=1 Tax=Desulfurivibrio alkaliphilus TaxID=427923 RepID=A0A7C2TI46_9BACT|nr:molecular chaperone DnaJ [Desulfurivibrio alkaliphilus]
MTFQELEEALTIFGLERQATLAEIKNRHRELVKRYHPDASPAARPPDAREEREIRRINAAYRLLLAYISAYSFSFSEEEFYRQNPEERLQHQFGNDPLWGNGWS